MAKKQTRRSVSLNRGTYERLRAYCETNGISMSQFVETRIGEVLGHAPAATKSDGGAQAGKARVEAKGNGTQTSNKEGGPDNRSGNIFTF